MSHTIRFSARSDVGRVRSNNEDNLYCNGVFMTVSSRERPFFLSGTSKLPSVFAVFDGMGGEDCGELASLTAAETLHGHAERISHGTFEDVNRFAMDANGKLISIMREQHIQTGTTMALISSGTESFTVHNLGDSRVYVLKDNTLILVTEDHTLTEEKVRMGVITPKQALTDRDRNVLTRCLGITDDAFDVSPDFCGVFSFSEYRRAMICSDGLTDMLSNKEIADIMSREHDVSQIADELVDAALNNGGRDNVTCIVLEFLKGE